MPSLLQLALAHIVKLLLVAAIAGVVTHRLYRRSYFMLAYLVAALVGNSLASFWPSVFLQEWFWLVKMALYDVLRLLIALELCWHTVHLFPGARETAGRVMLGLLGLFAALVAIGRTGPPAMRVLWAWQPRIVVGTACLLLGLVLVAAYYVLPLERWHRAILWGWALYLCGFQVMLAAMQQGLVSFPAAGVIDQTGWVLLAGWWAARAWVRTPEATLSPAAVSRLRALTT